MSAFLGARGLFHDDNESSNSSSKYTCPPAKDGPEIVMLFGTVSYRTAAAIFAGLCGLASVFIVSIRIFQHARQYSSPVQQRQIIRILLLVPYVVIFTVLIVWKADAGEYLVGSLDFGCSIALSAFLLLLCDFVLSHPEGFDGLFGAGALKRGAFEAESPSWLKRVWYAVLQFIPTSLIIWIATAGAEAAGTFCAQSRSPHFANIWITVIKALVTIIALVAVLIFYGRMKHRLRPHGMMLKLFSFKSIIGLNAVQTFAINILYTRDIIKPTEHMTSHDIISGLPALILACEMPIFAALLFAAFKIEPYKGRAAHASAPMAMAEAFNITDLMSAFFRGPMRLLRDQQAHMDGQDDSVLLSPRPVS